MTEAAPLTIQRIAIFPLPGAVLFPGLHLPLHIFEPRYKAMVQEVLARGILSLGTHNVTYAHTDDDVDRLLRVYDKVFPILREAVEEGAMTQYLRCPPLQPLFRVR